MPLFFLPLCSSHIRFRSFLLKQDFSAYLAFSGIVLHNAQLYETSQLENKRNQVSVVRHSSPAGSAGSVLKQCVCVGVRIRVRLQVLLDLATLIFEEQQCLEVLLRKIAGTILSFMQAQACTVFIADEESMVSTRPHRLLLPSTSLFQTHGSGRASVRTDFRLAISAPFCQ